MRLRPDRQADSSAPKIREQAFIALQYLIEGGKRNAVSADVLYNGTAMAGKLKLGSIAHELITEANRIDPNSAAIKSRLLRLEVEQDPSKFDTSLAELVTMVRTAKRENCELIYSESSNIAEHLRDDEKMVAAIESQDKNANGARTTSYADAILADMVSRSGSADWRERTVSYLQQACQKVVGESPRSTWYHSTMKQVLALLSSLSLEQEVLADKKLRTAFQAAAQQWLQSQSEAG